jgi:hypothetical protein
MKLPSYLLGIILTSLSLATLHAQEAGGVTGSGFVGAASSGVTTGSIGLTLASSGVTIGSLLTVGPTTIFPNAGSANLSSGSVISLSGSGEFNISTLGLTELLETKVIDIAQNTDVAIVGNGNALKINTSAPVTLSLEGTSQLSDSPLFADSTSFSGTSVLLVSDGNFVAVDIPLSGQIENGTITFNQFGETVSAPNISTTDLISGPTDNSNLVVSDSGATVDAIALDSATESGFVLGAGQSGKFVPFHVAFKATAVPEPQDWLLLAMGIGALLGCRRLRLFSRAR